MSDKEDPRKAPKANPDAPAPGLCALVGRLDPARHDARHVLGGGHAASST
jgi:hypothetical protein